MNKLDETFFTEVEEESGTALSYKITALLHEEQTPYQHIAIYNTTHCGHLMVIDGFVMLTQKDNFFYHEMISHPILFNHPQPENVLIIGGGDCGTLTEVLKHDEVKQVTQVDIDQRVTELAKEFFPELCQSNDDPRVSLVFADAIEWVAKCPAQSLDVIIIDSTDPIGPGEGLFTQEFYTNCRKTLREHGLLIQQSESPFYHQQLIANMHQSMQTAGFKQTMLLTFPEPCYPSGWWSATLAVNDKLSPVRFDDITAKTFSTQYYNAAIHQSAFAMPEFLTRNAAKVKAGD